MHLNKNKSQISIFIIIGLILVIVSSFLLYNNKFEIFVSHDTKLKNQISDVVTSCIENSARQGIFLLGFQGGYINTDKPEFKLPTSYSDLGYKIPSWDSQKGIIPTINSMQTELNTYILSNANTCVKNNLNSMRDYFDITIDSDLEIKSTINPENIVIDAKMPIRFNEKNSKQIIGIENYVVNLKNTRLGDLYNLATEIYNLEAGTNFLEDLVLDQIYSASDYSNSKFSMPSEGMTISCVSTIWTIPQLKKTLSNLNNNNFKYLQFKGTYPKSDIFNSHLIDKYGTKNYRAYFEKYYTFDLNNKNPSFENYNVEVSMPSKEITGKNGYFQEYPYREFKVTPSSGQIVKPMKTKIDMGAKIPIPCIQIYHHLYSLDYDLIFKLTDYNKDGEKFFFQFPVRVVIKNNNPKKLANNQILPEPPTATNEKFCSNESRKYEVPIFAKDANTGDLLTGVNISYKCINLKCDLGTTSKSTFRGVEYGNNAKLIGKFPSCSGGSIIASKIGYHDSKLRPEKDPSEFNKDSISYYELKLIPTKEFTIDKSTFLMVDKETKTGHRIYTKDDGYVYVTIENKGENFESFGIWPNEDGIYNTLKFLDGNYPYNVSIIYVDSETELKGMYELQNVMLDSNSGNNLRIVIPSTIKPISQETYLDFFNYMNLISSSDSYGITFI